MRGRGCLGAVPSEIVSQMREIPLSSPVFVGGKMGCCPDRVLMVYFYLSLLR